MGPAKTFLCGVTGMMLVETFLAPAAFAQAVYATNISVDDAHQMWLDGDFALVLDVRRWDDEFVPGHIPGAFNMPNTAIDSRISEIMDYQNERVLVYCRSGGRSAPASDKLVDTYGFTQVYNMLSGFNAWSGAGYETAVVPEFPRGDVNQDGDVDAVDVQLVINSVLGLDVDWDCDVDGDGDVNAVDVQLTINAVLGFS